ncbi:MAG: UDP-N-acetylmuramoyl-L-alanine--D-glutamate ligase [Bryobacteraceae bacterium]|nr:UDP-N-acetylmuramoyl-L-alanine--D-glutamate ligase [Bryobacteraceae bacterium]
MKYEVAGKIVLVAGMGKSGTGAAELLRKRGAEVRLTDSKPGEGVLPQSVETFTAVDLIVLSPGVPTDIPEVLAARERSIPVIGEVELASYWLKGPVIGITGSNGKTTTTAMTGHILHEAGVACQVGGNIGTAPTAMIDSSRDGQWNVLELSSFQLETIDEFHANIAAGLNLTPDHLDRHGSLENYANAKARLFDTQRPGSFAVLNADDETTTSWAKRTPAEVHWFSRLRQVEPGMWVEDGALVLNGDPLMPVSGIPLMGAHNVENAMAAAVAARLAGASLEGIVRGVRSFPGVEHRIEFVLERNGVRFYNDSKATNVDATEKAIDAFAGDLWIILGGKDKGSDYTTLRDKLADKAKCILLIGAAAPKIAAQLRGLPLLPVETIENAVSHASAYATAGDTVLLAPACASFDQFQSYEHRGRVFKQLVRNL